MQLPIQKIELLTCEEDSRFVLKSVLFDTEKRRLVATDGHMIAVLPHSVDPGDKTCLIPHAALAEARKRFDSSPSIVVKGKQCHVIDGNADVKFKMEEGEFPKWEQIFPKSGTPKLTICLDAEKLYRLAQALNADSHMVHLHCQGLNEAIIVTPGEATTGTIGALMPMRHNVAFTERPKAKKAQKKKVGL